MQSDLHFLLCNKTGTMLLWTITLFLAVSHVGKNVWLHLRFLPNPIFEGDVLTLKCQGWMHTQLSQVTFYKDGKLLNCSKNNQACFIETATVKNSGQYSCKGKKMYTTPWLTYTSEAIMVQVQGSQDLSTFTSSSQLLVWLLVCLLGPMVIAAVLLAYFRPWRKAG